MKRFRRILGLTLVTLGGLSPAGAISVTGKATTPEGEAIAGARAELAPVASHYQRASDFLAGRARPEALASAVTGAGGRFRIEAPAPGLYSVAVRAPGRVAVELVPLALTEAHELPPARLAEDVGGSVEVRDATGKPLSGAWIFARGSGRGAVRGFAPAPRLARTDARGTARVSRATGEQLDFSLYVPELGVLDERRGVARAVFDVPAMASEPSTVVARGDDGRPLAGVVVALGELAWPAGSTDGSGRLRLAVAGRAPLPVQLLAKDGRRGRATLGRDLVNATLPAPTPASGRVTRRADGGAVERAVVWPAFDPGAFTLTDAEGRYVLRTSGERRILRAQAAGYLPARTEAPAFDLALEAARPGFGRVVDPEGRPLAGAEVTVASATARPGAEGLLAVTSTEGFFQVRHLPAERVDLTARHRGYAPTLARGVRAPSSETPGADPEIDLGTLILVRGAAIRGRVRDAAGDPVVEAGVWLSTDLEVPADDLLAVAPQGVPAVTSDAEGVFVLEDLEPGARAHLRIAGEGFLPVAVAAVTAPTVEPLEIVLERSGGVRGKVTDEDGAAVSGAVVTLQPPAVSGRLELPLMGREHRHETVTGADGRFTFDTVAAGAFEIGVEAEGYVVPGPREVRVPVGERAPDVALVLERGSTLSGRVTDADGEPVAGARVFVADALGRTDDGGIYLAAGIAPGRHEVRVRHAALNTVVAEVEITEGENVRDFVLEAGHRVAGRVIDGDGSPVAGARVLFEQQDWENRHQLSAVTGDAGVFELPQVADGDYLVSALKAGHAFTQLPETLAVDGADVEGVDVVLPRGVVIRGRIFGLEADDLAGVSVEARRPGSPALDGVVDYDGAFEVADAGAGDWLLVATTPDLSREARARVAVAPGDRAVRRDLEFGGDGLEGQVLFGGEPLPGARVTLSGHGLAVARRVLADHEGAFRFLDLPRGVYRLAASHPRELLVRSLDVAVPDDGPVTVRLEAAKVHGYVRSSGGGPLAGTSVTLQQVLDGGEAGSLYSLRADAEGYFALPRLAAGRYRIGLRQDGYEELGEELELAAGVETGPLHYELEPTAGLTFQVVGDRSPPSLVTVSFIAADGQVSRVESRPVDAEGRVSFPTLAAGTWDVIVGAPGSALTSMTVTVPGEPVPLSLTPGVRVRVRVPGLVETRGAAEETVAALRLLDAAGRPLLAVDENGLPGSTWALAAGTATLDGVAPGQLTVHVETADGRTWSGRVALAAGGLADVLLDGGGASLQ